ncbi:MAG TPA: hypothetical protein DCQ06_03470 [Myxococcales bacterium]|nr:hypothetical protein [Myxococcales bacterium]HAN30636.1 hypothetical protein [Myxococcales bacterium]
MMTIGPKSHRWFALILMVSTAACATDSNSNALATADAGGDAEMLNTTLPNEPIVVINEVVAKAINDPTFNPTASDWVELYNRSAKPIEMDGWKINDSKSKGADFAYPLPPGLTIPAKGFLVLFFNKDGAGSPVIGKGLSSSEALSLFDDNGQLHDLVDWKDGDAPEGKSWGRSPDGSAAFATFSSPTPNAPNP